MKIMIEELYLRYGRTPEWSRQAALLSVNPILYLQEYQFVPREIISWKNDDDLTPAFDRKYLKQYQCEDALLNVHVPCRICVGIGAYKTVRDGELYMCTILDRDNGMALSYSFGVYRSPELVKKALEVFFQLYKMEDKMEKPDGIHLLSSRNPLYRTGIYRTIVSSFPVVQEMTLQGTRGGVSVVSTFYSQLMRKKSGTVFSGWQDGIDWLTWYIWNHNLKKSEKKAD